MTSFSDIKILESWQKNVSPWVKAIQEKQIASRRLVTDQAIINAVTLLQPDKVLDIGCGEGWLVRQLSSRGIAVTGIDAIAGLVAKAKEHGGETGTFYVMKYEDISATGIAEKYDTAVCNFSLLGKESVEHVFRVIPEMLSKDGHFIVQTTHPLSCCGNTKYIDGWREGCWQGFNAEFTDPAPWYFRTLESWVELYTRSGLTIKRIQEPINQHTGRVTSLLITGSVAS